MAEKKSVPARKKKNTPGHVGTSKYTKERHETIVEALRKGNSKANAFRLAGISPDTGHEWVKYGRDYPDKYPEYVKLGEDIEQALAEYEASRVSLVTTAADTGSWQAAAWWLERRNPEDLLLPLQGDHEQPQWKLGRSRLEDQAAVDCRPNRHDILIEYLRYWLLNSRKPDDEAGHGAPFLSY